MVSINIGNAIGSLINVAKSFSDLADDIDLPDIDIDIDDIFGSDDDDTDNDKPQVKKVSSPVLQPQAVQASLPPQTMEQTNSQLLAALLAAQSQPVSLQTPSGFNQSVVPNSLRLDEIGRQPVPNSFTNATSLGGEFGNIVNNIGGRTILAQRGIFVDADSPGRLMFQA